MSVRKYNPPKSTPADNLETPPAENPFFLVAAQVAYTTIGSRNPDATIEALADFGGRLVGEDAFGTIVSLGSTLIKIIFLPEPPLAVLHHICIRAPRMQEFIKYNAYCKNKGFPKQGWSETDHEGRTESVNISERYAIWGIPGKVGIKILWQESPYGSEGPAAPPTS